MGTGKDQDRSGSIATWDSGDLNRTNVSIDQLIRCRKWFDWLVIDCLFVCVCVCVFNQRIGNRISQDQTGLFPAQNLAGVRGR